MRQRIYVHVRDMPVEFQAWLRDEYGWRPGDPIDTILDKHKDDDTLCSAVRKRLEARTSQRRAFIEVGKELGYHPDHVKRRYKRRLRASNTA